jgi:hypothetical protein
MRAQYTIVIASPTASEAKQEGEAILNSEIACPTAAYSFQVGGLRQPASILQLPRNDGRRKHREKGSDPFTS